MLENLKTAVEKSRHQLENIVDTIEEQYEHLSEGAAELWSATKPKLKSVQDSLSNAAQSIHQQTDAAQLQAHLAIMDAHDQWTYLSNIVTELAHHAREKGQYELQYADLQAHLAAMEARDFMKNQGDSIKTDYQHAKDSVEKASQKAVQELTRGMETIGNAVASTM